MVGDELDIFERNASGHGVECCGQSMASICCCRLQCMVMEGGEEVTRSYDGCSSELVGGLCELCEGCGLDLDGVGCGDAQQRSECDELFTEIGIAIELLAELTEG